MFSDLYIFPCLRRSQICPSFDKTGSASNQIGFVNCPLTVSGASYLNSLYMQIYY